MKLKELLYSAFLLLTLGSCSKDNVPVPVEQLPNAKINMHLIASGPGATKADETDPNALEGEMNINSISALTFLADGGELLADPFYTTDFKTDKGITTVLNISTKAARAKIVILANAPEGAFSHVATYSDFLQALAKLSEQQQTSLTMSSQIITTTDELGGGDNYIGYSEMGDGNINQIKAPLELTRLAARVELKAVTTSFTGTPLAGRTIRINSIHLANAKTASAYAAESYWGQVMVNDNLAETLPVVFTNTNVSDGSPLAYPGYRQYVMENLDSSTPTRIVINATILADNGYKEQTKNFTAIINQNGLANKVNHNYVRRNYIYRLNIGFGGTSFEPDVVDPTPDPDPDPTPPDPTNLYVSVEVVGWGPVNQEVIIK